MAKSRDAFRTISEVADWLDTPAHVLRFWESRFSQVKPVKRAGGRRYYRPSDMELLGGIKRLLHDDGMTIKGVQKLLREEGIKHVASLSQPIDEMDDADAPDTATEQQTPANQELQDATTADDLPLGDDTTNDPIAAEDSVQAASDDTEETETAPTETEAPAPFEFQPDTSDVVAFPPSAEDTTYAAETADAPDEEDAPVSDPVATPPASTTDVEPVMFGDEATDEAETSPSEEPTVQQTIQSIVDGTLEDIVAEEIAALSSDEPKSEIDPLSEGGSDEADTPDQPEPVDPTAAHKNFSVTDLDLPDAADVPEEPSFFSHRSPPTEDQAPASKSAPESAPTIPPSIDMTLEEKIKSAVDKISGEAPATTEDTPQTSTLTFTPKQQDQTPDLPFDTPPVAEDEPEGAPTFGHSPIPEDIAAADDTVDSAPAVSMIMPVLPADPTDDAGEFSANGIRSAIAARKSRSGFSAEETTALRALLERMRALQKASDIDTQPPTGN